MPIQFAVARAAAINACSKKKDMAARFLEYLVEDSYNDLIIDGPGAIPPNPQAAYSSAFLEPVDFSGEYGAHENFRRAVEEFGVSREYS